jgi:hypothetical protein
MMTNLKPGRSLVFEHAPPCAKRPTENPFSIGGLGIDRAPPPILQLVEIIGFLLSFKGIYGITL